MKEIQVLKGPRSLSVWFRGITLSMMFFLIGSLAYSQDLNISGTVSEESGDPLPAVTVTVKGTLTGTVTDMNGEYSIKAPAGSTLVFSFVGMETQEVMVSGQTTVNITMMSSTVGLEELVVIGYGTQSRATITTSITKVGADKIENVAVTDVASALQGKLSGVRIYHTQGGQPGSDASILIRGGSSINKSNDPLVIVDGMVRSLDDINPNDIETVQVLKDASSTAIYGARASNGVVLVTTKRGELGKAEITFNINNGFASPWKYMNTVDAEDYLSIVRPAALRSPFKGDLTGIFPWATGNGPDSPWSTRFLGEGEAVPEGYKSMPDPLDPTKTLIFQDNDFQDITLNTALEQNYSISANGGTNTIKYAASMGYSDIEGTSVGTFFNRFNGRANVDFVLRKNLTLSTRMDHSSSKTNNYPSTADVFNRCIWLAPTAKVYLDDGSYASGQNSTFTNMLWYNDVYKRSISQYRTGLGGTLAWKIIPGLEAKVSADYFLRNRTLETFVKANVYTSSRQAAFEYDQTNNLQLEGLLTYDKIIALNHHINIVAGISQLTAEDLNTRAEAEGASTDLIETLNAAPLKTDATTFRTEDILLGMFGRITYDFKRKYLLGLSLRRDGSSRFAEGNRFGYFPGASLGYVITEEEFLKNNKIINTLKLRTSIGQTGNNSVGRYDYAGVYSVGYNYYGSAGTLSTAMPNPTLRWETTTQYDVGFDMGLFKNDRITLLFDYFNKVTTDLLFNVPLPNESGYNSIDQNVGEVKFWGYEAEVRAKIIEKQKFKWSADFNFGYFMDRVLDLPDNGKDKNRIGGIFDPVTGTGVGGIAEGERMKAVLGYMTDYIIDNWDQANSAYYDALATGWSPLDNKKVKGRKIPGDMEWVDQNGDEIIDDYDKVVLGYLTPTVIGGITNTVAYGNFTLNIFMDYALGHSIADATISRAYGNIISGVYSVLPESLTNTWKEEGDYASGKATMPRFDLQDQKQQLNYMRDNNTSVYKGDYLCLREVTLTYNAPNAVNSFLHVQSLKATLSGQNLHFFQSYPGWATEYSSDSTYQDDTYPASRKIMLGLKIGF
ncbi:MAG: TonB-dependent receptor [Bacteroidales bacterium]